MDNPLLVKLSESKLLLAESEKRKAGWIGEKDLLSRMFKEVTGSPEYVAYLSAANTTAALDRAVIMDLFIMYMAQFEGLHEHVENKSIHWLEDLDLACTMVKRTIEHLKLEDIDLNLVQQGTEAVEEREFLTTLHRETIAHQEADEKIIAERASNWEADRIALSDMLLMRMALTEARSFDLIPVKVTMNEYIEIAKAYSTPKSKNFINGILDKLFTEFKENGTIRKVGRGLLES